MIFILVYGGVWFCANLSQNSFKMGGILLIPNHAYIYCLSIYLPFYVSIYLSIYLSYNSVCLSQGGFDGRGQQTASPMLTAIMSGGVGISGRELYKYR